MMISSEEIPSVFVWLSYAILTTANILLMHYKLQYIGDKYTYILTHHKPWKLEGMC